MKYLWLACATCSAFLAASGPTWGDDPNAVSIQDDKFSKAAEFEGPNTEIRDTGLGHLGILDWSLRSWVDKKTGATSHQLYVDIEYGGGWRDYRMAADDSAETLPFVPISKEAGDCTYGCKMYEIFGVTIPPRLMRKGIDQGFEVKISGTAGLPIIVQVDPAKVHQQMDAITTYRTEHHLTGR